MGFFVQFALLFRLAVRSIWAHKVKSTIVGSLMAFGCFLVITGVSMLDSLENGMARSIVHSLVGHLQVYSVEAKDELSVYGSTAMSGSEVGKIERFSSLKDVVSAVPNVKAIIPMGINIANMTRGSQLDRLFSQLREAHRKNDQATLKALFPKAVRMLKLLKADLTNRLKVSSAARQAEFRAKLTHVERVLAPNYFDVFLENPIDELEFLDSKIAALGGEGRLMYLRYVGTDLNAFAHHFDRFRLDSGTMPKPGERGILINQRYADRRLKLLAARLFDSLEKSRREGLTIAENAAMKSKAKQLATQSAPISLMLSPGDTVALIPKLQRLLETASSDFEVLLKAFLAVDDKNLARHVQFFYQSIAPKIEIYPFDVGGVLTIRAFTKSGYVRAVNVRVHGTFSFKGLEASDVSAAANLVDLITFRELYGEMSVEQRAELKEIQRQVGVTQVERSSAEADLFGGDDDDETEVASTTGFSEFEGVNLRRERRTTTTGPSFTQADIDQGMALNAAVILDDPSKLEQTKAAIRIATEKAGLPMNVVDWRKASGLIGQIALAIRGILYIALLIIFAVSLVIINNSMLMATLERVREIGTLRAIGAQRRFVMAMILLETVLLCLVSGGFGALLGLGFMTWLNHVGIPAINDILVFVFSGPRLYPDFSSHHVLIGIAVILTVSFAATFFPARAATRVQPIEAMQSRE
ncbi:MAG: FtsX-like permease family protein [Myxococcota bacterium]|nr:FtsX-like permease family protein [Myxococcota bacterium]